MSTPGDAATATPRRMTYVPALDGMRGISLPGTIYTHFQIFLGLLPTTPWWIRHSGPFTLNIEMFFVLSGALITSLLVSEYQRNTTIKLDSFYLRRSRRLGPALLAVVPLLLISQFVLPGSSSTPLGTSPWMTAFFLLLFIGNWQLATGRDLGWLGPAWTLGIEEQFYLTWPALLRITLRRGWERRQLLLAFGVLIVLASGAGAVLGHRYGPTRAVYMTPPQVSPILLGCALGYVLTTDPDGWFVRMLRFRTTALAGLAGMVLVSAFLYDHLMLLIGGGYVLYGAASCLLIGHCMAVSDRPSVVSKVLGWRPFVVIGQVSYEAYLVHCIVILAVLRVAPRMPVSDMIVLDLVLIAVISGIFYYAVEQPIRRHGWRAAFRPAAVAARRDTPKKKAAAPARSRYGLALSASAATAVVVLAALVVGTAKHNPPGFTLTAQAPAVANIGLPPNVNPPGTHHSPSASGGAGGVVPTPEVAGTTSVVGSRPRPGTSGATVGGTSGGVTGLARAGQLQPPTVTSMLPMTGPITGGTDVTLRGTGFVPDHTVVYFGSVVITQVDVISSRTLRVIAPAADLVVKGATASALHGLSTSVEVQTPVGRSAAVKAVRFTYL